MGLRPLLGRRASCDDCNGQDDQKPRGLGETDEVAEIEALGGSHDTLSLNSIRNRMCADSVRPGFETVRASIVLPELV
jgi:hypothetical protein